MTRMRPSSACLRERGPGARHAPRAAAVVGRAGAGRALARQTARCARARRALWDKHRGNRVPLAKLDEALRELFEDMGVSLTKFKAYVKCARARQVSPGVGALRAEAPARGGRPARNSAPRGGADAGTTACASATRPCTAASARWHSR